MAMYKVKSDQNIFDVALHLYGSIEGLFDLLISNPELSMTSDLVLGQELEYHDEFILNQSIVGEFHSKNIVPSSGARHVYFKRPQESLIFIVGVNPESTLSGFSVSGEGTMIVDWGDNSELQYIVLGMTPKYIEHYFDNVVEKRRIKVYGNTETLKFIQLDTTNIGGAMILCRPVIVDEYVCTGRGYLLTGLSLLKGTYKIDLNTGAVVDLLPIGNLSLQELDLRGVRFINDNALDDYLVYISEHHNDRRSCTVYLTAEPSERGYAAIDKIINEPEWNNSGTWRFYINNQLYTPIDNVTDIE